jgi:hypothetical protein
MSELFLDDNFQIPYYQDKFDDSRAKFELGIQCFTEIDSPRCFPFKILLVEIYNPRLELSFVGQDYSIERYKTLFLYYVELESQMLETDELIFHKSLGKMFLKLPTWNVSQDYLNYLLLELWKFILR